MKTTERKIVPVGFAVAGLLFLLAAARPALSGESVDATFGVLSIMFFIFGFVAWRRSFGGAARPGA